MITFDREECTIDMKTDDGGHHYWIDLDRCTTPAQLLNWIFQLHNKSWMTADLMRELLEGFEQACREVFDGDVQGVFCPCGVSKIVNWKTGAGENKCA